MGSTCTRLKLSFGFRVTMKVLIIHRQQEFLQKVKRKFNRWRWHVKTTSSGLDGLLISRLHPFDLVLCGFDLPVISGTEILRTLRIHSVNKATPAFFISSGTETKAELHSADKLNICLLNEELVAKGKQLARLN